VTFSRYVGSPRPRPVPPTPAQPSGGPEVPLVTLDPPPTHRRRSRGPRAAWRSSPPDPGSSCLRATERCAVLRLRRSIPGVSAKLSEHRSAGPACTAAMGSASCIPLRSSGRFRRFLVPPGLAVLAYLVGLLLAPVLSGRVLGGPGVRAASGGSLRLPRLLLRVTRAAAGPGVSEM
jgi:hypothetical protein